VQITVRGAKDKELTKWLKKATLFFAEQLMSPNIYENLSIHIKVQDNTRDFQTKADCMWDDISPPPNPDIFHIRLAREPKKRYQDHFKSLAHEMVHVKQYSLNELDGIYGKNNTHVWRGIDFNIPCKLYPKKQSRSRVRIEEDEKDYYFHPWEIEAYGLEVGLIHYFVERHTKDLPYGRNVGDWD